MDMYSNTDTIWMPYGEIQEIQYNRYVQQYRYNTVAMWRNTRNTIQQICTAIQIQYGCHTEKYKVQPHSLSKQYNSWWKVQRSTLQFYSIGFFLSEEHAWRQ